MAKAKVLTTPEQNNNPAYDKEIQFIAAWYHADDEKATAADADKVRELLNQLPDSDSIGVLASRVESMLVNNCMSGKGSRVVLAHEIKQMRKEFGYDEATCIEKALIDRIVLCWLRVQRCEMLRAAADRGSQLLTHLEFYDKQLHRAHSRYMKSIEELAKVQFLMSRTNTARLAAVRAAMKGEGDTARQEMGKLLPMKLG
jgi:hypothetical protein